MSFSQGFEPSSTLCRHICIRVTETSLLHTVARARVATLFLRPRPDTSAFVDGHLILFQRIALDGQTVGTVYLDSDLGEAQARLKRFVASVVVILLGTSLFA